jgi:AraC-like DNA-binding protein
MTMRRYTPPPPLEKFVQCLWYWDVDARPAHTHERLLPNGEPAIIFNLRNDAIRIYDSDDVSRYHTYGHAVLSGAHSNYFVIDTTEQQRVAGIQFHPGGAFPFFRAPADEMSNASIALDNLWGGQSAELREQMLAAPSVDGVFHILEQYLLAQLVRSSGLHPAIEHALLRFRRAPHTTTIASMTEQVGFSSRRFIEIFRQQVGLTPKTFCRVRRFKRALHTISGMDDIARAQVALDGGYYDQAHFIRDFQAFSGLTPSAYMAVATPHLNHVPIL